MRKNDEKSHRDKNFHRHKRRNIENTDAYKMLSILYGLVTFIGGVAFSISHAIIPEDEAEHIKHLAEIYFTYLYCVSISWIIFCIFDIVRHREKLNSIKATRVKTDRDERVARSKTTTHLESQPTKVSLPPTFNLQLFDESQESLAIDEKNTRNTNESRVFKESISSESESEESIHQQEHAQEHEQRESLHGQTRDFLTRRHALDPVGVTHLKTYIRHRNNSFVQRAMGYNYDDNSTAGGLYIRVGIGIFCLGTVIHAGLAILSNLENIPCVRWTAIMDDFGRLLFCFIQFFFIFKHSNLIIRAHESIARLAVMHIVVTNLCVWFRMVVVETKSQIIEMGAQESQIYPDKTGENIVHHIHHISSCTHGNNHSFHAAMLIQEGYMRLKPLLYPCTIEFSLMCLTLFFLIWENIGKPFTYKMSDKASTKNVFMVNCHASIKGLFSGMIIFSATLISIILYAVFRNKIADDQHSAIAVAQALLPGRKTTTMVPSVYLKSTHHSKLTGAHNLSVDLVTLPPSHPAIGPYISIGDTPKRLIFSIAIVEIVNLTLLCISLVATTCAMMKIRKFQYRRTTTRFDDVLIIVSLTGTYLYTLFSAFALLNNKYPLTWIAYLKIAIVFLEFAESTIHAFFILLALRKRLPRIQQNMYPGREVITLLIILDLSLWFEETTTTTKHEANPFQLAFYHIIPWSIIAAIATPLQIFFRFHASVCLSHVWENMYIFPAHEPIAPHGL